VLTTIHSLDVVTTILFWLHMRWIAVKMDFRGSRWRALVAMIGTSLTIALLQIGTRWSPELRGLLSLTPTVTAQNLRFAMTVLWSAVSALVVLRFALGFANEVRLDRQTADQTIK
jgi:hypothetical protein